MSFICLLPHSYRCPAAVKQENVLFPVASGWTAGYFWLSWNQSREKFRHIPKLGVTSGMPEQKLKQLHVRIKSDFSSSSTADKAQCQTFWWLACHWLLNMLLNFSCMKLGYKQAVDNLILSKNSIYKLKGGEISTLKNFDFLAFKMCHKNSSSK